MRQQIAQGWTVLDKDGRAVRYAFGFAVKDWVVQTKKEANRMARALAERADELECGDINRWEFGQMAFAEVRRRGFRVVQARLFMEAGT